MKEYTSDKIRNVAVLSHDGAGKTAVVESLLLACGAVDAVGVSGKDFGCHPVLMSDGSLIRKGPAVAGAVFGGHPAFALVLFGGAPGPSAIVGLLQQNVAGAQF